MPGPVILDLLDKTLSSEEAEILNHPLVGGVILFARNYDSPKQLTELCRSIRASCKNPILITVDHEGGRVQRFREGFTSLPSMGTLGELYAKEQQKALELAEQYGAVMAKELLACGIDFSFAPVLDLNKGICPAIGDRSFHQDPSVVSILAKKLMQGMKKSGMISVGKHFPGHGSVKVDSHIGLPKDSRSLKEIEAEDILPFKALIAENIQAMMPAHIIFSAIDDKPVGFSRIWLQDILRKKYQFKGVIISDDLNMQGAAIAGGVPDRAEMALKAGCDMILICNNREGAIATLDTLPKNMRNLDLCQQRNAQLKGQ